MKYENSVGNGKVGERPLLVHSVGCGIENEEIRELGLSAVFEENIQIIIVGFERTTFSVVLASITDWEAKHCFSR